MHTGLEARIPEATPTIKNSLTRNNQNHPGNSVCFWFFFTAELNETAGGVGVLTRLGEWTLEHLKSPDNFLVLIV